MHPYQVKMRRLRLFQSLAIVAGLSWAGVTGWLEYATPPYEAAFDRQRYERLVKECRGERMSQRFDCRAELLLSRQQNDFYDWTLRVLWVAGPPLFLLWLTTKLATPKRPSPGGVFKEKPELKPGKRKTEEEDESP